MSINIKNQGTCELARELAELTGESLTAAINEAVKERLARLRRERHDMVEQILALGRECAALLGPSIDHGELLYDELGMPR